MKKCVFPMIGILFCAASGGVFAKAKGDSKDAGQTPAASKNGPAPAPAQPAAVEAPEVHFRGNFFDLLVHLSVEHGIECGIDPSLMRENALAAEASFDKRPGESVKTLLDRFAREKECTVRTDRGYHYFTNTKPQNAERLKQFEKGNYAALMAAGDPLGKIAALAVDLQKRQQSRTNGIRNGITAYNSNLALAKASERPTRLSRPDPNAARDYYEKAERAKAAVAGEFHASFDEIRTLKTAPAEYLGGLTAAPFGVITNNYLESLIKSYDICTANLGAVRAIFSEANGCASALSEQRDAFDKERSEVKARQEMAAAIFTTVGRHFEAREYAAAFSRVSALQELDDFSTKRYRMAYGRLAILTKAESVKKIALSRAEKTSLATLAGTPAELPAGISRAVMEAVADYLKTRVENFQSPKTLHDGSIGKIDGLAVRSQDGEGVIATKAIQFLPKGQPTGNPGEEPAKTKVELRGNLTSREWELLISRETVERPFEVHGINVNLDLYTQASIYDSLSLVQQKYVPDLFEKNKISVVFDSTVNVNHSGDSGGAAFALAALSTAKKVIPQADVAVTGAVRPYGDISPVGGVYAKTTAAVKGGYKVLLIPDANAPDVNVMDFDKLGPLQVIRCGKFDHYIGVVLPSLADKGEVAKIQGAMRNYAAAYLLYRAGDYSASKAVLKKLLTDFPNHLSAQMLLSRLKIAKVEDADLAEPLRKLIESTPTAAAVGR